MDRPGREMADREGAKLSEVQTMPAWIVFAVSQAAEIGVFFAAAAALVVGALGLR